MEPYLKRYDKFVFALLADKKKGEFNDWDLKRVFNLTRSTQWHAGPLRVGDDELAWDYEERLYRSLLYASAMVSQRPTRKPTRPLWRGSRQNLVDDMETPIRHFAFQVTERSHWLHSCGQLVCCAFTAVILMVTFAFAFHGVAIERNEAQCIDVVGVSRCDEWREPA